MIKQTIAALLLSVGMSSVLAAGTVKVFSNGSREAKTLTGAEYLIDLVGQPRLANSWWPGAVISEELATAAALRQQQALLARLAALAADSSGDDAAAINTLRQQIQALKVTGRQKINLDPDMVRVAERGNPPLQGNYTLWVGSPPSTVTLFGLISRPGNQPFTPVVTWRVTSPVRTCLVVRIAATHGLFIQTVARKKRRWLTGTSVT